MPCTARGEKIERAYRIGIRGKGECKTLKNRQTGGLKADKVSQNEV